MELIYYNNGRGRLAEIPGFGSPAKSSELLEQVYRELRAVAGAQLAREAPGHTLQATALVHQVFLKLQRHPALVHFDASLFFDAAAQAMRRILIGHARTRGLLKRGGGTKREFTDVADLAADQDPAEILALDEAIGERDTPRLAPFIGPLGTADQRIQHLRAAEL